MLLFASALVAGSLGIPQEPQVSGVVAVPAHLVHPGGSGGGGPQNVGTNLKMNLDVGGSSQNEFGIAVNPKNRRNLIASANDYRLGDARASYYVSKDGGKTIVNDGVFGLVSPWTVSGDPSTCFDSFGNGYFCELSFSRTIISGGIFVHKTTDGGSTFLPAVAAFQVAGNLPDKCYIAADPRTTGTNAGSLYVTFTGFYAAPVGLHCVASRDGGATWSAPVPIGTGQGTSPAVGPSGEVYVAWGSGNTVAFNSSLTFGTTWTGARTIANITGNPGTLPPTSFRCNSFPSCAVDTSGGAHNGRIYVSWSSRSGATSEIFSIYSTNQGVTWSSPVQVNDVAAGDQFFQWMAVDEHGVVYASWFDRRNDVTNTKYDCYASASYDGGVTWIPNWKVSTVSSNPGTSGFIGDYSGLAAGGGRCYPAWCQINGATGQDCYTAPVQSDLEYSPTTISAAAGGTINLPIKAGPLHAGQNYIMFANLAGESAIGTPFGPFTIWLNIDPLVNISLGSANTAPFLNTAGVLGAGGIPALQPKFTVPAGLLAPVIGLNIGFEYGTYLGLNFTSVSNAVLATVTL